MSVVIPPMECYMTEASAAERLLAMNLTEMTARAAMHLLKIFPPSLPAKSKVGQRKTAGHCTSLHLCVFTLHTLLPSYVQYSNIETHGCLG